MDRREADGECWPLRCHFNRPVIGRGEGRNLDSFNFLTLKNPSEIRSSVTRSSWPAGYRILEWIRQTERRGEKRRRVKQLIQTSAIRYMNLLIHLFHHELAISPFIHLFFTPLPSVGCLERIAAEGILGNSLKQSEV